MHWKFTFEKQPLLLHIKVSGNIHKNETTKMAIEGIALARQEKCQRFIVDFRNAELKDSQTEIYQFSSNLEQVGLKRTDRIAIIIAHDIAAYHFAETVAANRGWSQIKYFKDPEAARTWVSKY